MVQVQRTGNLCRKNIRNPVKGAWHHNIHQAYVKTETGVWKTDGFSASPHFRTSIFYLFNKFTHLQYGRRRSEYVNDIPFFQVSIAVGYFQFVA